VNVPLPIRSLRPKLLWVVQRAPVVLSEWARATPTLITVWRKHEGWRDEAL
jgi:hypothetical protein